MTVPLMRRRGVLMSEAAAMANVLTLPLAATATLTAIARLAVAGGVTEWVYRQHLAIGGGAAGGGKLAGIKNSLPLAGAFTGSLACENLSAIADSCTAGDERAGIMRDAALRIHPRVARVSVARPGKSCCFARRKTAPHSHPPGRYARFILLSFYLRMLARGAVADKGK